MADVLPCFFCLGRCLYSKIYRLKFNIIWSLSFDVMCRLVVWRASGNGHRI